MIHCRDISQPEHEHTPDSASASATRPLARRWHRIRENDADPVLARRYGVSVYDGDAAGRSYLSRCTPTAQPRLLALAAMSVHQRWLDRSPKEIFEAMPSLHGETFGFVVDDVLASDPASSLLVDDFRTLPRAVVPLLSWPRQALFLVPTPEFRRAALSARYADPARARADWGELDPTTVLEARLARDALWDFEIVHQVRELDLPLLVVGGDRSVDDLVARFRFHPS